MAVYMFHDKALGNNDDAGAIQSRTAGFKWLAECFKRF